VLFLGHQFKHQLAHCVADVREPDRAAQVINSKRGGYWDRHDNASDGRKGRWPVAIIFLLLLLPAVYCSTSNHPS